MTSAELSQPRFSWPATYFPLLVLIGGTALLGPSLGATARPLFLVGCLLTGWLAWSRSAIVHAQVVLALFCAAPFLRRLVDFSAGFDKRGLMIAGPLLALLVAARDLPQHVLERQDIRRQLAPLLLVAACVGYAALITTVEGDWSQAVSDGIKWGAPLLYAMALYVRAPDVGEVLDGLRDAVMVILPLIGAYGIYQYVDPPLWDQYWMTFAAITSAGLPEPYAVRVFSTMHAPAAFASFTATGIFLVYFLSKQRSLVLIVLIPAVIGLLLSLYRTAWLSLAASVMFCAFYPQTRKRAAIAAVTLAMLVLVALALTPFAAVISDRLATLGEVHDDSSLQERLEQFQTLWASDAAAIFGKGFSPTDVAVAGSRGTDGLIAVCWTSMGIVIGIVCLAAILHIIANAVGAAQGQDKYGIILGALAVGQLVQLPFAAIASGELGFLFWMVAALALLAKRQNERRPPPLN